MRFLDNMITVNKLPLKEIEEVTKSVRSIGLGMMGLADTLYLLGIKYGSPESVAFCTELFSYMQEIAQKASETMAIEKGAYPAYKGSAWEAGNVIVRNSNFLSIAPTGSISFLANASSGIEPNFALVYTRLTHNGDKYYVVNDVFKTELVERGLYSEELLEKISNNNGSCIGVEEIPKDMQNIFVTASDVLPQEHVEVVAAIQSHVDLGISKTVNLPSSATVEDVMDVYMDAWQKDIKGITVYKNGSRQGQVLSTGANEEDIPADILQRGQWATLAPDTTYYKRKIYIGCGKLNLFIGWSHEQNIIQDLYVVKSASGGCTANLQGMAIAMSGMLRLGGNIFNIEKAFEGIGVCPSFVAQRAKGTKLSAGSSCGTAILNEIKIFLKEMEGDENNVVQKQEVDIKKIPIDDLLIEAVEHEEGKCPECGAKLRAESGCYTCTCGFSMCG